MSAKYFLFSIDTLPDMKPILLTLFLSATILQAQPSTPFSADSALAYVRTLSVEIGPRPMGSPGERKALEFAVGKFREFDLDARIMPMTQTISTELNGGVNTNSGIAVGILKGASDRVIVIGGHIDSSGPEIPGANDDGSGSAVVVELARVLSQTEHASTLVFALFGGEEQGLRGSSYFVNNFPQIDKVSLMLQVDMANGTEWLLPLVDAKDHSSPEWLIEASYEEMERLGYSSMYFPTHFYTLLTAMPGGGIGSDHQPFLERGIPAIDFTSDVNDPIHTPQDNFENFKPGGLKRSGDLVYRLVQRFDDGVPDEEQSDSFILQFRSSLLFFPLWSLRVFILISIILSGYALVALRTRRKEESPRMAIPSLKLFLLMLIIQTCVWLSENVVGLLKGTRIPWFSDPSGYFILGFVAALFGIWIALRIAPSLRLSQRADRYYLSMFLLLVVLLALCALASVKLALYPAIALFMLALAVIVQKPWLKLLFWVLSPYFMYYLIFNEGFGLMSRLIGGADSGERISSILLHISYILFFSVWAFPFLLGFAAIRFDSNRDLLWLSHFRKPPGGVLAALAFLLLAVFLSSQPTFSSDWKQTIRIEQRFPDAGPASVEIASNDYLKGAHVRMNGHDSVLTNRSGFIHLTPSQKPDQWIKVRRKVETTSDSFTTYKLLLSISTRYRPYTLGLTYSAGKQSIENVSTPYASWPGPHSLTLRWYSFPDTSLTIPLTFTVTGTDSIRETIEATFVEPMIPIEVSKESASVRGRTLLRTVSVLKAATRP